MNATPDAEKDAERGTERSNADDEARRRRRFGLALAGLFVVALALRAGFSWEVSDLPTFRYPVMDAASDIDTARGIAGGAWLPRAPFYRAPLYPYFLALFELATGAAANARVAQVLLSAATPVLLALAAMPVFGRRAALLAGLLGAFYGPHVVFAPLLLKESLAVALLAAALALLVPRFAGAPANTSGRNGGRAAVAALAIGLLLGLASGLRENLLVLLPVVAAALAWRERRIRPALLVAGGGVLALFPVGCANAHAGGPWFLTSSQSGMNFYIGNVLSASGTYQPLSEGSQHPEAQREDARRLAAQLAAEAESSGGARRAPAVAQLDDPAVSRIFWQASRRSIAASPGRWTALLLRKLRLFWSDYEVPDAEGWVVLCELSAILALAPLTFAPLLGLAAIGLLPAWQRARAATVLLLLLAAATCASVVAFFVFGRYRLPVVLFLLPFAGVGVAALLERIRNRRWASAALLAGAATAATLLADTSPLSAGDRAAYASALWYNLGQAGNRETLDRLSAARAAASGPDRAQALRRAGASAAAAAAFLERALADQPQFALARLEHAVALERGGLAALLAGAAPDAERLYAAALADLDAARAPAAAAGDPELAAQIATLRDATENGLRQARELRAALAAAPPNR